MMQNIKSLAPTIFDTLQAIEQGCRRIQEDLYFQFQTACHFTIIHNTCIGCLPTSTLMQLTQKSGQDLILLCDELQPHIMYIDIAFRAKIFGIAIQHDLPETSDFFLFEKAIHEFRNGDFVPLLQFYQLDNHPQTREAEGYHNWQQPYLFDYTTHKQDLIQYAVYLKDYLIPKMKSWFAPVQ